ncbi:sugar-binding transcriptional regulator [Streptomyces sp. NEAU-174]|uniref:sugar-binding transcriptional regulator n=1 Tax=Streptomyces sp. NEAU-174 TaxID=3458254 RepID=UPI004043CA45
MKDIAEPDSGAKAEGGSEAGAAEKQSGGGQADAEGGGRAHAGVERCRTENLEAAFATGQDALPVPEDGGTTATIVLMNKGSYSCKLGGFNVMRAKTSSVAREVVQLVGGSGSAEVQLHATRLTSRLAELTGARPVFAPSAAPVGSRELRDLLSQEPFMTETMKAWSRLTQVLVGIGTLQPSPLLRRSGNAITTEDQWRLGELGAVGDVCTRYFDISGKPFDAPFNDRLIGIEPDRLRAVERRIGVAGGVNKVSAIRGAVRGGWVNVLITDVEVARELLAEQR